ncbi:TPA: hypothetical protein EYP66_26080 [Candidatus Poribacteria bacterium]|nr:hypothetical protein [Candidatus Poribacteria bacterium]
MNRVLLIKSEVTGDDYLIEPQEDGSYLLNEVSLAAQEGRLQRLATDKALDGDFRMSATISAARPAASIQVFFAANQDCSNRVYWSLTPDALRLYRVSAGKETLLRDERFVPGQPPWRFSLLKRGAYYLIRINEQEAAWVWHPSGDVDTFAEVVTAVEPASGRTGFELINGEVLLQDLQIKQVSWAQLPGEPILSFGPLGSWYEGQLFPGALLKYDGTYYLYVNGSDLSASEQESGGRVRVGVATSTDLQHWELHRGYLLEGKSGTWDAISIMVNGAVLAPDGRVVISYMGWNGSKWSGIGLAFSDNPEGPFEKYPGNPVLRLGNPGEWDSQAIHEHHLTQIDNQYVLFYTGYDGYSGDKVGIATSTDLIHWQRDPNNPVMGPTGPKTWDSVHVRGRSLIKIGDMCYALYEGAAQEKRKTMPAKWCDTIGLARSKDLISWERHPLNPILPQQTGDRFDSIWTGWPRMWVEGEKVYIFYGAGGNKMITQKHHATTGLRILSLKRFLEWK